jgi:DNA-binding transcriptional LysR family regulator
MDRFADMQLFLAVAETGGFAAGGRRLGLSPASVTARIAALEERSGVRLFNRTTRTVTLTDEGQTFGEAARNILAEIEELDLRLTADKDSLSGYVRIAAPFDLGRNRIAPVLDRFMAEHPRIKVELLLSDGFIDLVGNRIDLALRYGNLPDSSLMARRLGDNRRVVCASPDYLERHGTPETPEQLAGHNCLIMLIGDKPRSRWEFLVDGKAQNLTVSGNRITNDGELIRRWALEGQGIALKSIWDVHDDLAQGRLVELLKDFAVPDNSLQLVYPTAQSLPKRTRALINALVQELGQPNA